MSLVVTVGVSETARGAKDTLPVDLTSQHSQCNLRLRRAGLPEFVADYTGPTGQLSLSLPACGLERLRRIAAHVWYWKQKLPPEESDDVAAAHDEFIRWYLDSKGDLWGGPIGGLIARTNLQRRRFDQLMLTKADLACFLPVEFVTPLEPLPESELAIPHDTESGATSRLDPGDLWYTPLGSAPRLHDEMLRLSEALDVPADVGVDEIRGLLACGPPYPSRWEDYTHERLTCAALRALTFLAVDVALPLVWQRA
jgi:hypothetical protein